jgi:glucose-6-phosphate 1-dehydrogenase
MTICGATGDLTKRKLIPALCNLAEEHLLPEQFAIVGFSADDFTTESFRKTLMEEVPKYAPSPIDPKLLDFMFERMYYVKGDFQDPEAYQRLEQQIAEADKKYNTLGNRLFYLAVAPRFFSPIVKMLGLCCLSKEENGKWARIIVEKPFGHDLASAKQLNQELRQVLNENQIYRIDHYLGKETVQNVMVFRFSNNIIEPLWNRNYVDHVQITAAETVGVEHRGGFYETAGALRDMVPNHLFQLQPEEGISLSFGAKVPGSVMKLGLVNMDFDYSTYFGMEHSTGYERLLRDCMAGDATLFQRADMVEAGWTVIQPVLDVWHALPARGFPNYAAGSWGPIEADELLEKDGRGWRRIGEEELDHHGRVASPSGAEGTESFLKENARGA